MQEINSLNKNMASKLEKMMKEDGWELKSYVNSGRRYFVFHKEDFQIRFEDIDQIDKFREWVGVKI